MKYPAVVVMLMMLALAGCEKLEFQKADGNPLAWDSLRGQWVLVNYWAEWCKPCREEIPELNDVDALDQVTVVGVNFDGIQGQSLTDLGRKMGIHYTLLQEDPGPALDWTLPVALPATFVVKPDGTLLEARFGAQTRQDIMDLINGQ